MSSEFISILEVYIFMKRKITLALLIILVMAVSASAFSGREKWTFQPDSSVTSGIAISGNTLFFGSETGRFYALNKNSGQVIWDFKTSNTIYGNPAIIGNRVVFAQADGEIICLNISDGSPVWSSGGNVVRDERNRTVNDGLFDGATPGGGMLFVSKADKKLHALSDKDGKTLWTYTSGSQGLREAPAYSDGLVFLGEYDGIFSIIDAKTGKRLNGGGAGGAINTPTVSNGNVYFSSWDGSVNAVKIKGVEPLWNVNVHDTITTQPAIGGGKIVVGTGRGAVIALGENNGRTLWRFNTNGGNISATPVIADGLVFAGGEAGGMFVLDASTGRRVGQLVENEGINADALYSDGVLYFGGSALYAYE